MKKLLLFAFAASVTTIAGAQIQFGAKAGLNLANLSISPKSSDYSLNMKPDFNAGVLVSIPLFSKFSLQPEIMYSAQGSKLKSTDESGTYNMNYINVPVLFKYKDASGFFAEIGPQLGILTSAKAKSGSESQDLKDELKSTDFSGVVGIGYLSRLNLGIDARYNLGLSNIVKESSDGKLKNGVIQVGVFYMFGKSRK